MLPFLKKTVHQKKVSYGASSVPFNPIDGNTIALWDGDFGLSGSKWDDVISTIQITLSNSPTVDPTGLNGHGTVTFDGVNQYGNSLLPVIATPHTIYLVCKQINWNNLFVLLADGIDLPPAILLQQNNVTPRIRIYDADSNFTTRLDLTLNTWSVITIQSDTNIYNLRINLGTVATGTGVNPTKTGLNLANYPLAATYSECAFAYIIERDVADDITTQNKYVNYLMNRFAI